MTPMTIEQVLADLETWMMKVSAAPSSCLLADRLEGYAMDYLLDDTGAVADLRLAAHILRERRDP